MRIKKRILITLISSLVLCAFGVFRLLTETLSSGALFTSILFAVCGFIGAIGNIVALRRT